MIPSVEIKDFLCNGGITYFVTGNAPGVLPEEWGCSVGYLMEKPDKIVAIFDGSGMVESVTLATKQTLITKNIQITVRGTNYITTYEKAEEIQDLLQAPQFSSFTTHTFNLLLPVYSLGRDENGRFLFGMRFNAHNYS